MTANEIFGCMKKQGWYGVPKMALDHFKDIHATNILALMIEKLRYTENDRRFKDGWFSLNYSEVADALYITPNKTQSTIQRLIKDGFIIRKHGDLNGLMLYKFIEDKIIEVFGTPIMDEEHEHTPSEKSPIETTKTVQPQENQTAQPLTFPATDSKEPIKKEPSCSGETSSPLGHQASVVQSRPVLLRRKVVRSIFPTTDHQSLFNHWNSLDYPLPCHKADEHTKVFQHSMEYITHALKKHSLQSIKDAMTNYHKILLTPQTILNISKVGVRVSLAEFFRFSSRTESLMLQQKEPLDIVSWFDVCLKGPDHLDAKFGKVDKDPNPEVTAFLMKKFKEKIADRRFSSSEKNIFIKAAAFVVQFHSKHSRQINFNSCPQEKTSPARFSERLIDALVNDAQDKTMIEPVWLLSPRTQESRLPKYLRRVGLLSEPITRTTAKPADTKRKYNPGYGPGESDISISHLFG